MSKSRVHYGALPEERSSSSVLESLADGTRRAVLRVLQRRDGAVDAERLATLVVEDRSDSDVGDSTAEPAETIHTELVHVHLPKLAEAGLVDYDADERTVDTADHAALRDEQFRGLYERDGENWDDVLRALAAPRRRVALAVLETTDGLTGPELARGVAAREYAVDPGEIPVREQEETLTALHHVHLPALEEAGLIDRQDGQIRSVGHPELPEAAIGVDPEAPVSVDGTDDESAAAIWSL